MNEHDKFCLIPEAGLNVTPNGVITPCCAISDYKLGHITEDSLSSVFFGEKYQQFRQAHRNNQLPAVCIEACVNRNNSFVHRTGRNEVIQNSEAHNNKEPGKEKLIILDIGLGNICNLTCTFCDETWSSSWAKLKNKNSDIFSFDLDTTLNIAKNLNGMVHVSFKGGEPLNIPYLDKFLNEFYINNKDCTISLVSNGTETNDRINDALFKFRVVLTISTEATGKLYQYMRGGKYTWDDVLKNIKSFIARGCEYIEISSVISIYNYTTWSKDMLVIQTQLSELGIKSNISAQLCIHPNEESLFLLNQDQRQRLVNLIMEDVNRGLKIQGLEEMTASILTKRIVNTTRDKVIEKIQFNNSMRNMDLFDIVEDFTDHLDL
jgi:radical SAM protein with 4Fe4S-binding SPASM domain